MIYFCLYEIKVICPDLHIGGQFLWFCISNDYPFQGNRYFKRDFVMKNVQSHGKADIFLGLELLYMNAEDGVWNYAAWRFNDFFIFIFMIGIEQFCSKFLEAFEGDGEGSYSFFFFGC